MVHNVLRHYCTLCDFPIRIPTSDLEQYEKCFLVKHTMYLIFMGAGWIGDLVDVLLLVLFSSLMFHRLCLRNKCKPTSAKSSFTAHCGLSCMTWISSEIWFLSPGCYILPAFFFLQGKKEKHNEIDSIFVSVDYSGTMKRGKCFWNIFVARFQVNGDHQNDSVCSLCIWSWVLIEDHAFEFDASLMSQMELVCWKYWHMNYLELLSLFLVRCNWN